MVGVVGSSPIAPTKQNPLCWAVWKGSPKGGPFFVVCDLQNFFKLPLRMQIRRLLLLPKCLLCPPQPFLPCLPGAAVRKLPFVYTRLVKPSEIEGFTCLFNRPVIKNALFESVNFSNIRPAFTTTVYAFLNPKLPSAAWDFFCLRFGDCGAFPSCTSSVDSLRANPCFFDYY